MVNHDGPSGPPPGPGSTFGPYRIDSVIGVGGMGVVYMATDQRLDRRVALKVVIGHLAQSPEFVERFQREAASLARLQSPHVVQIFDHGVEGGVPFIATQYAAGGDLGRLLAQRGPMPPALAAELCAQVADALRDAHRVGVVHRDVKPANVLLRDDRLDRVHVLLCDFGVAQTDGNPLTEPGTIPGTWNYLSPERIAGQPGSAASDVYAVGCLLWEAITGRPPYDGSDVEVAMAHQQAPIPQLAGTDDFTQHANRILAGTLAKEPSQRYQTASVLRDDLRSLAGIPSQPPRPAPGVAPPTVPPPPGAHASYGSGGTGASGPRRTRVWVLVAAAAALVAIGVGALVAVATSDDDPGTAEPTDLTSAATSEPTGGTDPTEPVDPTEPTEDPDEPGTVDTSDPIRGDVDGDGFGDLAFATFDGTFLLRSDGSRLADPERRKRPDDLTALTGDVDNDGTNDIVRLQGEPPRMNASVLRPGAPTSPITTPDAPLVTSALDVATTLGDVDGDGNLDLVLQTRLTEEVVGAVSTQIDVALGDGEGRFAATTTWFSETILEGQVYAVDVDGDGDDDLVKLEYDDDEGANYASVLTSDGTAFEKLGEASETEGLTSSLRTADVDGDGAEEIVSMDSYGPVFYVWSWNGATFDQEAWYDNSDTLDPTTITSFVATDLNGDHLDDIVVIALDDALDEYVGDAFISDGTALTPAPEWSRPFGFEPSSYHLLDREGSG